MRKAILEERQAKLIKKHGDLMEKAKTAGTVEELRGIQEQLNDVNERLDEVRSDMAVLETRDFDPAKAAGTPEKRDTSDKYATMEYRMAFKEYAQRGTAIPAEFRAAGVEGVTGTTDVGAIIPTTVMNEIIKNVSKVYGQVYGKVRKISVKGGVKFPIGDLKASFKWITESTVSPRQKGIEVNDYVEFSYNVGEIRVAQTLLASIVALDAFESEVINIMTEAYVEAMDKGIINGSGDGQLLGITKDPRVTNVVTMTAADLASWKAWRTKLFAKVPLSKRGQGEFLFTASTVESYLLTMQDSTGRPIFKEATELTLTDSNTAGRFFGRDVTLVEPDVLADADTASSDDIIGIYWVPSDYCINTNYEFQLKRYFDEDLNQWIDKGLVVVDGKILDPAGCYIIKKG